MRDLVRTVLCCGILATSSAPALAVTVNFSGVIDDAGTTGLALGSTFGGSFSYNAAAPAAAGSDTISAVYDALTALSFSIVSGPNTYAFSTTGAPEVQIGNQGTNGTSTETSDRFAVVARDSDGLSGSFVNTESLRTFVLRLDDPGGTLYGAANGGLPGAVNLSSFATSDVFLFFETTTAHGTLRSLGIVSSTAPEPASWALLVTGFGAVGASLRYRRTRAVVRFA